MSVASASASALAPHPVLLRSRRVGVTAAVLRRPLVASLVLFATYAGIAQLNDPRAFLGPDTGGKVATLRAMATRGDLDPDLGYWAQEHDPSGVAHPIALTRRVGDRWVNVTTFPMLYAAVPLYEVGGLRAIVLLPMLGGVLTALAARALARRLGGSGDAVFWLVGMATPVAVYALDFWAHTLGAAAMLWGIVALCDVADGRGGWRVAAGGGLCFGLAATMRTEAFVYAAVTFLVVGTALARRSRSVLWSRAGAAGLGFVVPVLANQVVERVVLGEGLRAARTAGAAAAGGGDLVARLEDALRTTVGLNYFGPPVIDWVLGMLVVVLMALGALALLDGRRSSSRLGTSVAVGALVGAALLFLVRFEHGVGFIPGMLVASPLAVVGLVAARRDRTSARLAAIALLAMPLVWLFRYGGGANAEWGGRYVLVSGVIFAVIGIRALARRGTAALATFAVASLLLTGCGVGWLVVRSRSVARALTELTGGSDPVVTRGLPQLLREGGAFYEPGDRWLTVEEPGELPVVLDVLDAGRPAHFTLIARYPSQAPQRLGSYSRAGTDRVGFLGDVELVVARYRLG